MRENVAQEDFRLRITFHFFQVPKPNIVFILLDDLGWKDLGCYGSSFYETPNLDKLAAHSLRFTDAYAACPVCSPTRASILTGKYPATLGLTDWIDAVGNTHPCRGQLVDVPYLKQLPQSEFSLARALQSGGYDTWHVGKWHLGKWHLGGDGFLPEDHGFAVNVGGCHVGSPYPGGYFSPWAIPALAEAAVPEGTYLTDYLTERAIGLMEGREEVGEKRPFFLNLCYYTVHTPIEAKADKIAKYEAKAKAMGLDKVETFAKGEPFPTEHKRHLRVRRRLVQSDPVYAAMIESLDENIGRLLAALDATGERDNTIIIFTSDNGGLATAEGSPTCNAPLAEGKGWMYEGGTREPLFIQWHGVTQPNAVCTTPVTSPDFYPTLLDMAGLPPRPEQHCDGVSLVPLLHGQPLEREAIFWHYPHYGNQGGTPGSSVRAGDFKLLEFFEDNRLELYNLRDDIGETADLSQTHPHITQQLHEKLKAWRQAVAAKIPQPAC